MMRIGVDLGGTKIEAIALDAAGRERARRRVPTPRGDYRGAVEAVRDLVVTLESELGEAARVGVGTPGAVSRATGRIKNANSTHLNGQPFVADLSEALQREVRVENDANCFALSEASDGAGAGHRVVFGVILGTGVGGGIVVDGRVWVGPNAIAGEWGHNELPSRTEPDLPDRPCYCGRRRCIETYLSGPALAVDHAAASGLAAAEGVDALAVVAAARAGDAAAQATLQRYCNRLASALAGVVNILDPDIVVLGGGLSNVDELYAATASLLPGHVFSDRCTTPIVRNRHGDSSGVRGAAWLWPAEDRPG
ncbi:MAG TPA: ROK family protein [Caldimonas sp.]|nr:ROK family protein [Caldimonas sp.]HEX2543076.1 ROK family protein [Caldimonas sp.]